MAYLNAAEREALLDELKSLSFRKAKGRLRRMDPKGRMAYYRNAQRTDEFVTCFVLEGKGTRVELVETLAYSEGKEIHLGMNRLKPKFTFSRVVIEPTPENRT
jgi:hypothetical protein